MIVDIIRITNEVNDCLFYIEYKVNGRLREMRCTKIDIIKHLSMQLNIGSHLSSETFDNLISQEESKTELFYSYLKYFHYI